MSRIKQICYHVKCEHGKTKDSPTEREEGIKQKQKVKNAQNDKQVDLQKLRETHKHR